MQAYDTESHLRPMEGQNIQVVNLTPRLPEHQRQARKRQVEEQLYQVFCSYVPRRD